MENITLAVPSGSTNHGNPSLLCVPPRWYDYVIFFAANYFAHAATVIPQPGQSVWRTVVAAFLALILPFSGVWRAVGAILSGAVLERDPLRRAARASALCMVVGEPKYGYRACYASGCNRAQVGATDTRLSSYRMHVGGGAVATQPTGATTDIELAVLGVNDVVGTPLAAGPAAAEEPLISGQGISSFSYDHRRHDHWWSPDIKNDSWDPWSPGSWSPWQRADHTGPQPVPSDSTIQGMCMAPKGYAYVTVPLDAPLIYQRLGDDREGKPLEPVVSSTYNPPKILVSVAQAIWASVTLYRARGDQVDRYGYAAFGLTVTPYAMMSILNLLGNLMVPDYPTLHLVRTPWMDLAEAEGGRFIGELRLDPVCFRAEAETGGRASRPSSWGNIFLSRGAWSLVLGCVCIGIVVGLGGASGRDSTSVQRAFTIIWLVIGVLYGSTWNHYVYTFDQYLQSYHIRDVFRFHWIMLRLLQVFPLLAPCIGGMVVVGLMIRDFGICTLLS